MNNEKVFAMSFRMIYNNYVKKAEKKGRNKEEIDKLIFWLLGYDEKGLQSELDQNSDLKTVFDNAPNINEKASMIKGKVCGVSVQDVEDKIMRHVRYLDKLVDELAKGKDMETYIKGLVNS